MDWKQLKDKVYFVDGSLRDIYIKNTTRNDWALWADYVNKHFKLFFSVSDTVIDDKIDIYKVFDYWDGKDDCCLNASIFLGDCLIKTYFFTEEEIENDIMPTEVNSMETHLLLVDYMSKITALLKKKVILTPENPSDTEPIFIEVNNNMVTININY